MLLKLHAKLAPEWALIRVKFDPLQEIGHAKVGGGRSFVTGPFFARLGCTISLNTIQTTIVSQATPFPSQREEGSGHDATIELSQRNANGSR